MFVENCLINTEETLFMPNGPSKLSKKKNKKQRRNKNKQNKDQNEDIDEANKEESQNRRMASNNIPSGYDSADLFHPVRCTECNTEVAVYDADQIYHFFNVLSSYTWFVMLFTSLYFLLVK